MRPLPRIAFATSAAALCLCAGASADIIAKWDILTGLPSGSGSTPTGSSYSMGAANTGALTAGSELLAVHASALSQYTTTSGNGSQYSFSSDRWAAGDYYQTTVSTLGYSSIGISFDACRSTTGPGNFALSVSVDGGSNFATLIASAPVLVSGGAGSPGTWAVTTSRQAEYLVSAAAAAADNRASVIFRWQALAGGSGSSGTARVDNVQVTGTIIPASGSLAALGAVGLFGSRRRRR